MRRCPSLFPSCLVHQGTSCCLDCQHDGSPARCLVTSCDASSTRLIFVLGCRQPDSGVGSIRSAAPPTMSRPLFQPCPKHQGRLDSVDDAFDSLSEFFRIDAQSVVCHIVTKLCPLQRFVFCFCFWKIFLADLFKRVSWFGGEILKIARGRRTYFVH